MLTHSLRCDSREREEERDLDELKYSLGWLFSCNLLFPPYITHCSIERCSERGWCSYRRPEEEMKAKAQSAHLICLVCPLDVRKVAFISLDLTLRRWWAAFAETDKSCQLRVATFASPSALRFWSRTLYIFYIQMFFSSPLSRPFLPFPFTSLIHHRLLPLLLSPSFSSIIARGLNVNNSSQQFAMIPHTQFNYSGPNMCMRWWQWSFSCPKSHCLSFHSSQYLPSSGPILCQV